MSNSLLYHAFGIRDVKYKGTKFQGGAIIIEAMMNRTIWCPECAHRSPMLKGQKIRRLRMSPHGRKPCYLDVELHRLKCRQCGHLRYN